ncbi:MAG: site-specific integrase [Sphingomonas sp.]|nr:site-specific integrase [Sphingomonas sp.]
MKEQVAADPLCDLLDRLRLSARSGRPALLQHADVLLLMSDKIYGLLAGIESHRLREFATGTVCRSPLCEHQGRMGERESASPSVQELISEWLKFHVSRLAAPQRYYYSATHLNTFFSDERRLGRLGDKVLVKDLTPEVQARFREWRSASGAGGHTVSRDLAALRGALTWAWKHQRIPKPPPFIADMPAHTRSQPRDRVLSQMEVAAIIDACAGRSDREHVIRFIVIELGTAGRPQAVLELEHTNIDFERNLINPNHPGRTHARKRRAIVPMARAVRPWVVGIEGKLIKYRVAVTRSEAGEDTEFFERETKSIRRSWKAACEEAGVSGATPKTLRHTMLTWLAERGVPYEQRQILAGHSARGTTARHYEHLSPSYLKTAIEQVDAYFIELRKLTSAIAGPAT